MDVWMYDPAWHYPRRIIRPEKEIAKFAAEPDHEGYILFFARLVMEDV